MLSRIFSEYVIVLVLLALAAFFSVATWTEQAQRGAAGGAALAQDIARQSPPGRFLVAVRDVPDDAAFAEALEKGLTQQGWTAAASVRGHPADAKTMLDRLNQAGDKLDAIACTPETAVWLVFDGIAQKYPRLGTPRLFVPRSYSWPTFLTLGNLLNIAHQIGILAILAIGMTLVIIAGGIDLSVGSLMALAAVTAAWLIREHGGADQASVGAMVLACTCAIAVCSLVGFSVGLTITWSDMPPFIVTLGVMMIARGSAFVLADSQSIYQVPETIDWLGRGADLGIPNVAVLMLALYIAAHVLMTRTVLGRYIYAVGGNREAARLAGVPVSRVIVQASRLRGGSPTYGQDYELYAIAAVVIGGTSLRGGEGGVIGTFLGVLLIAISQNGMNMIGVSSDWQRVVFGAVMLAAVLVDSLKRRGRTG
jgi:ribose/xylose/arabinose/galactoside ABC-type transport system permease subunit